MCSTKAFIQLATATCPGLNRPSCLTVKHEESSTPVYLDGEQPPYRDWSTHT